ncbi:MAG TPA: cellobiohydrolase [Micromonosporaceae bacterium]|nr:cellobiohydrolase [Micromonosporaceae bacterium]
MNLRKRFALAGTGLLVVAGVVAPTTMAHAAASCEVVYTANNWTEGSGVGGFTANLTVKNTGDAWSGWTLTFALPSGQSISLPGWSATWSASGQNVTAVPLDWNRNLGTGAQTGIGFNGRWTGSYSGGPTAFAVNGVACNGGGGGNQAPAVSLTSPTAGSSFASGAAVPLAATASDPDGTINRVEFLVDGALVGSDTSSPYTFSATGLAVGSHTAQARAFDNGNPALSTTTPAVSFSVTGTQTPSIVLTPNALSVNEGGTAALNVKLNTAPSGNVTVALARTGDTSITAPASVTLTTANWSAGVNATVSAAEDSDQVNGTATIAATATGYTGAQAAVTELDNDIVHVDNPYAGATGYVNPDWRAKANAEPGGSRIANTSTGVWLDRIAAIAGSSSAMGLRAHLNEAVAQDAANGSSPLTIQVVIYNLPNRDCSALASNGELLIAQNGLNRYKAEYIDPIAAIMAESQYSNLRIVAVIEIDSLPNLITNLNVPKCQEAQSSGAYVQGIQYALTKLHAIPNVYNYIDAAHHGWIGWDTNFGPSAQLFSSTANGATGGRATVDGFITNTANYSALVEPHFTINSTVNGQTVRQSRWVDWNFYVDELSFAQAFRQRLIQEGFASNIGMLIDTSRNGWGGSARPGAPSTSTDMNTFVDQSRIDRRIHAGNWCNQSGAGLGERPRANPAAGIDAYVWIKPPGESDGSSTAIPNNEGKGFDRMCDPTYGGNERNGNNPPGALPNSPLSGHWFSAQFQQLMANAYPAL